MIFQTMTEILFKVIIIGDPTVGKTSFVQRYVNDAYRRDYKMTIGVDFALKVVKWSDTQTIKLQLWDIAGQERFTSMTRVYYKDAHACIIMFDLTQQSTFQNAVKWKKDLDTKCSLADGSPIPCLLLANKVLMRGNDDEACGTGRVLKLNGALHGARKYHPSSIPAIPVQGVVSLFLLVAYVQGKMTSVSTCQFQ